MKTFFFVTVFFLFTAFNVSAQHTQFGIKGGINIAGIDVEDGNDLDSKVAAHIGVLAHIHVTRHFAVQPELVFSMQGGEEGNLKAKQNFINIPVLLQYMTGRGFRLQTGPQLGFLVSAENEIGDVEYDVKDQLNTIDLSWSFGASYITVSGFGVDARYNHGLTNTNEAEQPEAKQRVWQLGVFYQFRR